MRDPRKEHGKCVYRDTSSKGGGRRHDCWRAEAHTRDGKRMRKRFRSLQDAKNWCGC